ncbi:MAG: phospholipid/cholesterol/gamma-HCH transport system substrate-binding protein [Pseudomonadota bacterium]|nr:phospholipid/cholesterol/gamma-HCH transport system substrate-binding protein [Pseudomonadota bacterium]
MKRLTIDFMVGIFVLIGICSLAFLSIKVATNFNIGSSNNQTYALHASFSNIGSLKVSAPVKVSGFVVGRVTDIHLNTQTYQAVVTMNINDSYKFSNDTSAQILTTGLLGEQYVALQSGADTEYLKNGDTITLTSSAMVLEDLIGKFMTSMTTK